MTRFAQKGPIQFGGHGRAYADGWARTFSKQVDKAEPAKSRDSKPVKKARKK